MKNIKNDIYKVKCLLTNLENFKDIIQEILKDKTIEVGYSLDGISIYNNDKTFKDEEICEKLSKYFDVKITSFHADDCDYPCIWIVYNN